MDQEYAGRSGDVGGYQVEVGEHWVRVLKDGVEVVNHQVSPHEGRSIGQFVATSPDLRLRWGRLPLGDEVILLAGAAGTDGEALSYAINVTDPDRSGWTRGNDLLATIIA